MTYRVVWYTLSTGKRGENLEGLDTILRLAKERFPAILSRLAEIEREEQPIMTDAPKQNAGQLMQSSKPEGEPIVKNERDDDELIASAHMFAVFAHEGQYRKYTGEPYRNHPIAVAEIVQGVPHSAEMVAAAYLHDVVEDCNVRLSEIGSQFGSKVAFYVHLLTDKSVPGDGNRAVRKAIDRERIAKAPPEVKTIKLADIIDNTRTIAALDPKFWKVYREEKLALLEVLRGGDPTLWARAMEQCR